MTQLLIEQRNAVRILTLNRPAARNALTSTLAVALADELDRAETDDDVRVVVLTGANPAFCAGLDLTEFSAPDAPRHLVGAAIDRARAFDKPLVGAINGPAVAGGLELALACDTLIGSPAATFRDTHLKILALSRTGMAVHLPRAVGSNWARRMALSGDALGAETAQRLGLLTELVTAEELVDQACELAGRIAVMDAALTRTVKNLYAEIALVTTQEGLELERQALAKRRARGSGWKVGR